MSDENLEELWSPYRYELTVDYVGVWELDRHVRRAQPELDDESVRETVLLLIERALDRHEAQVGTLPRGVEGLTEVWREPVNVIIHRIRREWIALGRAPDPGELVWLQRPRPRTK